MNNDELQQNGEQKQPDLLTYTRQRSKTKLHCAKIAGRVGAFVIAAGMAFGLVACVPTVTDPSGDVEIVCPECGGDHTKDQHQNNQKSYSDLLRHVVENPSYVATLNELKEYNDYYDSLTPNQQEAFDKENPRAMYKFNNGHPYAFLADKGYDVNAIKNGECLCVSRVMFDESQPTKVYMTVSVSNPKTGGFVIFGKGVTQYMLAYTLTKQEVNEYKALLNSRSPIALFYPDAIAKLKKPEILLESHIDEDTYEWLRETLYRRNSWSYRWWLGSAVSPTIKPLRLVDGIANDVLLKSYDLDNQTFDLIVVGEDSIADYRGKCINSEKLSFYHEDGISLQVPGMYYFHWTEADDFVQKKARPMTVYGTQIKGDKIIDSRSSTWRNDSNFGSILFYDTGNRNLDPDRIYQIVDEYMLETSK